MKKNDQHSKSRNDVVDAASKSAIAEGLRETVSRYGSASAEYVKAYRGLDHETGQKLAKGLKEISDYKVSAVSDEQAAINQKQQAGFSAEVQYTADRNADAIISGKKNRTMRSDDHQDFGKNHQVYDHVEVDENGNLVPGTGSQMKFVSNPEKLLKSIAEGEGGGKTDKSRYLNAKINLPSEQVEAARNFCESKAREFREKASKLRGVGKRTQAEKFEALARKYDQLKDNIRDSNISSGQALFIRKHPMIATALSIGKVSHAAGMQGAQYGAAIGGAVAAVTNLIGVVQDKKDVKDAICDTGLAAGKAAVQGYSTAFAASALKGTLQQSPNTLLRQVSRTNLPALAVTVCVEVFSCVKSYVRGEIDGVEFLERLGEKGTGLAAGGFFAVIGQIAIPVPILGAAIGSLVGCVLSSYLYKDALSAFKEAKQARENYLTVKEYCEQARFHLQQQTKIFRSLFEEWVDQGRDRLNTSLMQMDAATVTGDSDEYAKAANEIAMMMGKSLTFKSQSEFDRFMESSYDLIL